MYKAERTLMIYYGICNSTCTSFS